MTTGRVVMIVLVVTFLEYLYIQQNAASLAVSAITGSAPAALGAVAGGAIVDVGSSLVGAL